MRLTGRDDGQATVELAIALPLVVVLLLGVIQVVIVVRDQLALELAAREGARAASVAADPSSAARRGAIAATTLRPLEVTTAANATRVNVRVAYTNPTNVPVIGVVIGNVELSASVTLAREPP